MIDNNIVTTFTYIDGEINDIVFDLTLFGITSVNFVSLYIIKNAEYIIKFE